MGVTFSSEGTSVQFLGASSNKVTSSGDNLIRIVNDDGRQVRAISQLPDFMQSVVGSPDGVTLVGGGEDSVLRIWNGTNGKELASF